MIKDFLDGIIDLVYPRSCILCRDALPPSCRNYQLCFVCQDKIRINTSPGCQKCSRPTESPLDPFCGTCRRETLSFDRAWGACIYDETMRRLIHLFKYGNKTSLRHVFAELILTYLEGCPVQINDSDLIIPVPLHTTRFRERGYNQSRLIAEIISARLNIPLSLRHIKRARHTGSQTKLSQKERWTNIQGAFKIKHSGELINKNIIIIDDLYTTGATTSEIARLLRDAGGSQIIVLTLAIALHNSF